jgi:GH15 family glucan-1,4-alpha-glucosidase
VPLAQSKGRSDSSVMSSKIEDYALLGDCETAALVARDGSIDWLCWPRFDSCACFAALLGGPEHGRWLIRPLDLAARVTRRYRTDTLILETDFETVDGAVTLIDFMPPRGKTSDVVRMIVGRYGHVTMHNEVYSTFRLRLSRALGNPDGRWRFVGCVRAGYGRLTHAGATTW